MFMEHVYGKFHTLNTLRRKNTSLLAIEMSLNKALTQGKLQVSDSTKQQGDYSGDHAGL